MPARILPLVTDQLYHIFNRGSNKQPIFLGTRDYYRALKVLQYCAFTSPRLRFSQFLLLPKRERVNHWERLHKEGSKLVEFISFTLMPNHFHLLLKQTVESGISKFMSSFQNSYTRYFNSKHERIGPLLQGQFKAVRVEDEGQLLHVHRYIHLNPYSSFVVKTLLDLENYPWSSLPDYLGKTAVTICAKEIILTHFPNANEYRKFIFDQADYQRELENIKHLALEDLP